MPDRFKIIPTCYLILLKGDKTYLLKRANTHYFEGYWGLPAGHVEAGEVPLEAAIREVKEEAGVRVKEKRCSFVHAQYRIEDDDTFADYFFVTREWQGEPHVAEPEKASAGNWFRARELPEKTVPVYVPLLKAVLAGEKYVEYDETKKEA